MEDLIFMAGKVLWAVVAPSHLIVILLILSLALSLHKILRLFIQGIAVIYFIFMLLFPVGEWALLPLEQCLITRDPPMSVDGVVVLGGMLDKDITEDRGESELNGAADRLTALLKLHNLYPGVPIVYSGGSGSLRPGDYHEADEIKRLMMAAGLDTSGIAFDGRSRNTYEDSTFTREYYAKVPGQSWLLVTSAWHMPRALSLFEAAGTASQTHFSPYPADYATSGRFKLDIGPDFVGNLDKLDQAVKEYIGLVANKLLKRTPHIWPCTFEEKKLI